MSCVNFVSWVWVIISFYVYGIYVYYELVVILRVCRVVFVVVMVFYYYEGRDVCKCYIVDDEVDT